MYYILNTIALAYKFNAKNKKHKFASFVALMATIGIALGVCALIIVTSVMQGLENRLENIVLQNTPHIIVNGKNITDEDFLKFSHVKGQVPFIKQMALIKSNYAIGIANINAFDLSRIKGYGLENFKKYTNELGDYKLILDAQLIEPLKINYADNVTLISTTNPRYSIIGINPVQRNFTISDLISSINTSAIANCYIGFNDAKRLFRINDDNVSVALFLDSPKNTQKVVQALGSKYNISTWYDEQGEFFKAVATERITMSLLLFLIIIVAAFNILSSLTMMVGAKLTDIAILKTIGLYNSQIYLIFTIMGMLCGIIGSIIGIILGISISLNLPQILEFFNIKVISNSSLPISINYFNIFIIFIISIALSAICSIYPAIKASRVNIVRNLIS